MPGTGLRSRGAVVGVKILKELGRLALHRRARSPRTLADPFPSSTRSRTTRTSTVKHMPWTRGLMRLCGIRNEATTSNGSGECLFARVSSARSATWPYGSLQATPPCPGTELPEPSRPTEAGKERGAGPGVTSCLAHPGGALAGTRARTGKRPTSTSVGQSFSRAPSREGPRASHPGPDPWSFGRRHFGSVLRESHGTRPHGRTRTTRAWGLRVRPQAPTGRAGGDRGGAAPHRRPIPQILRSARLQPTGWPDRSRTACVGARGARR